LTRRGKIMQMITVNGVSLHVEDHGSGTPVLLMHGWPDSARLWRHQIPVLVDAGYRVVAPDMRGFGRSDRPTEVAAYRGDQPLRDMVELLDALNIETAHLVGHDWGAFIAWLLASRHPERVRSLTALSVPHPAAPRTLRQREMSWYQLFFLFEGVAEAWLQHDDWALFREFVRGDGDLEEYLEDLSRPGALTASLNWYRANLVPQPPPQPGAVSPWGPLPMRTLGIWSERDHYLDGERMRASSKFVTGEWRYEQIADSSHWIPLDQPGRLNELLLEWLADT
jgi:pimeloyl-ACP methyl ester carboxylesterase